MPVDSCAQRYDRRNVFHYFEADDETGMCKVPMAGRPCGRPERFKIHLEDDSDAIRRFRGW